MLGLIQGTTHFSTYALNHKNNFNVKAFGFYVVLYDNTCSGSPSSNIDYGFELIESQTKEFNEQHINRLEVERSGTTIP